MHQPTFVIPVLRKTLNPKMSTAYKVGILDCRLPKTNTPTIRLRIYYPTKSTTKPAPWLPPHPTTQDQTENILSFLSIRPTNIFKPILTPLTQQPLPFHYAAPIADGQFPVVLFSHGLGGSIGGYSAFCGDLAAEGRVVLAPEHSDGSAFVAYVGEEREKIPYTRYMPSIHGPSDQTFRKSQLEIRLADCRRVIASLANPQFQPLDNSHNVPEFIFDTTKLIIAGHSFGAATALLFGAEVKPHKIICLDAWLQPIQHLLSLDLGSADCLFVDMGSGIKQSIEKRELLPRPSGRAFVDAVSIEDGLHNNSSDFPMRIPKILSVIGGMTKFKSDPAELLRKQSFLVETFLSSVEEWLTFRKDLCDGVVVAPVGRARSLVGR